MTRRSYTGKSLPRRPQLKICTLILADRRCGVPHPLQSVPAGGGPVNPS